MTRATRPLLAVTCGDPAGIGPEVVLGMLAHAPVRDAARWLVLGPPSCRPARIPVADASFAEASVESDLAWIDCESEGEWSVGTPSAASGRAALSALRRGHELAFAGDVDALVTAPVSKRALHMAGERVEGQTQLFGRWCGVDDPQMLAVAGELRVMLLTRHLPLREALDRIDEPSVVRQLHRLRAALVELGIEAPQMALAGLNPHAGESGLLGAEEGDLLAPAVARARSEGLDVVGPLSPDSIFLRASRGEFDGVLALYHDQAFIPIKLIGEGRAVTVLAGIPYLRISPAHGTAFDLAGTGRARPDDMIAAGLQAAAWAVARTARLS